MGGLGWRRSDPSNGRSSDRPFPLSRHGERCDEPHADVGWVVRNSRIVSSSGTTSTVPRLRPQLVEQGAETAEASADVGAATDDVGRKQHLHVVRAKPLPLCISESALIFMSVTFQIVSAGVLGEWLLSWPETRRSSGCRSSLAERHRTPHPRPSMRRTHPKPSEGVAWDEEAWEGDSSRLQWS